MDDHHHVKFYLLSADEVSRLKELGADLAEVGLTLSRDLSRREMLDIWKIISELKRRTGDEEDDNNINWALGDWVNYAEDRFGSFLNLITAGGHPRPRVIVSYKHQDSVHDDWVNKLTSDLRSLYGVDARLDDFEVDLGESFSDYMTSEIDRDSDALLFVITPASVAAVDKGRSGVVHFEMQLANARRMRDLDFRIIGIYREGDDTSSYLRDHRYADFREDGQYDDNLRKVAFSLWGLRKKPTLRTERP